MACIKHGYGGKGLCVGCDSEKMEEHESTWKESPPGKGEKDGRCNRTVCQQLGAFYLNKSTKKYYCMECARRINDVNVASSKALYGCTKLCALPTTAQLRPTKQNVPAAV